MEKSKIKKSKQKNVKQKTKKVEKSGIIKRPENKTVKSEYITKSYNLFLIFI